MRGSAWRKAVVLAGTGALIAGMVGAGSPAASASLLPASLTSLVGDVVHGLDADTALGSASGSATMQVGVGITVDSAARQAAFDELFTPGSPTYHHFYTPASFDAAFGANQAEAQRVRDYATRDGLKVVYSAPDGSYLELSGTTAAVDSTFSLRETVFRSSTGKDFTANATAPKVPAGVDAVSGLTSLTVAHSDVTSPQQADCQAPVVVPELPVQGLDACVGALTPQDVRSVYGAPSGDLGAGQKVAIFGDGELANVVSDLRAFEKIYDQPVVPVHEILVGDDRSDSSGDPEWDLDSQAITGMAPDLQELDFYFGSNLNDPSITATYEAWANDPDGPLTGNSSFGSAEPLEYLGGFLEDTALQQAAMEGRTMFASAGDVGGSCLPGENGVTNTVVPCVEYPASSPYVVSVGGTVLYTKSNPYGQQLEPAQRALEYAWSFSGGGHSMEEPAPPWQIPALPKFSALPCVLGADIGKTCRGVPDVSAVSGDVITNGYAFVYKGAVSEVGGTSLSSPIWAGAWANVQAAFQPGRSCADPSDVTAEPGSSTVSGAGFAAPELYAVAEQPSADAASFFNVGGSTQSVPGAGNLQQVSEPRNALTDPTGYSYVSGLGSPILGGLIGNIDCGHLTATTASTYPPDPATPAVYVYGSTPPYNTPSSEGCGPNGQLAVPDSSAVLPEPVGGAFALTHVSLTSDSASTTFAATVANASTTSIDDVDYAWTFTLGGAQYAVTVDTGPAPAAALYSVSTTSTPTGIGVVVAPTKLAALTPDIDRPSNTISVSLPFATFAGAEPHATGAGALDTGSVLEGVSVDTNQGPALSAIDLDFDVDPLDQANFLQCSYLVGGSPAPAHEAAIVVPGTHGDPWLRVLPVLGVVALASLTCGRRARRRRT